MSREANHRVPRSLGLSGLGWRTCAVAVVGLVGACHRASSPAEAATPVPSGQAGEAARGPAESRRGKASKPSQDLPVGDAAPPSDEAPRWPSQTARPRAAEDPVAGKRSEAEWRAHLAREDRERLLARDRSALEHHRAIMAMLLRTRRNYDRARSPEAVGAAQAQAAQLASRVEQALTKINLWGNVSPLTSTYRSLVQSLREDFPRARTAALRGSAEKQTALRAEFDRRMRKIKSYLREAAQSEGQGE
jgi:hypothetical protein